MSTLALITVNGVLAAIVLVVMVRLHAWAILTAHRDHVRAIESVPVADVTDQRAELGRGETPLAA